MTRLNTLFCAGLAGMALAGGLAQAQTPPGPAAAAAPKPPRTCFSLSDWDGWSSPSRDVLYMKVRLREVYRVDLTHGSNRLNSAGTHLVSHVHGSDRICSPLDLDLRVSDGYGMAIPIRAKAITKLTPEQIAAIPKKDRP